MIDGDDIQQTMGLCFCQGDEVAITTIWPNGDPAANDNVAATRLQGYPGVIKECSACHPAGSLPVTSNGPHGLHNIADARWYSEDGHGERYERDKNSCKACHGADLSGTPLAKVPVARSLRAEGRTVNFAASGLVGGNHCHKRPALYPQFAMKQESEYRLPNGKRVLTVRPTPFQRILSPCCGGTSLRALIP